MKEKFWVNFTLEVTSRKGLEREGLHERRRINTICTKYREHCETGFNKEINEYIWSKKDDLLFSNHSFSKRK